METIRQHELVLRAIDVARAHPDLELWICLSGNKIALHIPKGDEGDAVARELDVEMYATKSPSMQ